jgi:transposase
MPAPYSMDLRERVVAFVEAGGSRRAAAKHFAMSPSCVIKLMQRKQATGSAMPAPQGGQKPHALARHADVVTALVGAKPDITLKELQAALAECEIATTITSIWRFLAHLGLTHKKSRSTRASKNART